MGNVSQKANNVLHNAAETGNVVEVQLHVGNFDINAKGEDDDTALVKAAGKGHTEIVKLLLNYNDIDVNIPNRDGQTALIYASNKGHTEIVQALLCFPCIDVNLANVSMFPLTPTTPHPIYCSCY